MDELGAGQISKSYDTDDENLKVYHILIGLMLSSQTKDEVTFATSRYLIEKKNLSIETIMKAKESEVNEWIAKVGFHNKKAAYIKKAT